MDRIMTYEDLLKKVRYYNSKIEIRKNPEKFNKGEIKERHILICGGPGCKTSRADNIADAFREQIEELNLQDKVKVIMTGCFGFCAKGPVIEIMPDRVFYVQVNENDVKEIVESHILGGNVV